PVVDDLVDLVHGFLGLRRQERAGQRNLDQRALAVFTDEPFADERIIVGEDATNLRTRLFVGIALLALLEILDDLIDEREVVLRELALRAFDGDDGAAGINILRKSLAQQVVTAHAVAPS